MGYNTIGFERSDYLGILTLNRPERLNALSLEMLGELRRFFTELCDDYETRVVIIRGAGRGFCAGIDLGDLSRGGKAEEELGWQNYFWRKILFNGSDFIRKLRQAPQPIIAAVHGAAAGGGFSVTMACDMRIAAESARFNAAFVRIGLSGGDMGSSYFLPRLIGMSKAAEYLYTGRFIDAATADSLGLVSRVVPDDQLMDSAIELGYEVLRTSPLGLRATKECLNFNIDAPGLESALQYENRGQALCAMTDDYVEGPLAFREKRSPEWKDQ